MATFFGFDEHDAQGFIDRHTVCLPHLPNGKSDLHGIVSFIRNNDIVFIKHCTRQSALYITAIGVVQSDFPSDIKPDTCLPVEWVWQGEKALENFDELMPLRSDAFYEEHDILVQREIIDLLPERYQLPSAW